LVVWPKALHLSIIGQAGLSETLPVLQDFCQRWEKQGKDLKSSLWQDAHTLAGYLLRDTFYENTENAYEYRNRRTGGELLACLFRLGDIDGINRYWQGIAKYGFYQKADSAALVQSSTLIPWDFVVSAVEQAFTLSAIKAQEACAALLAGLSSAKACNATDLNKAAQILFAVLPGDPQHFPELPSWQSPRITNSSEFVSAILTSFSAINNALADDALTYFLAWPTVYDVDNVLVAAALLLIQAELSGRPVVTKLQAAVIAHINVRVMMTLEPPADWRRDNKINCLCSDCKAFKLFLDEPTQPKWQLKAVEARRKHVEQTIQKHQSDVICSTLRVGSPHTLVCTKNQASYLRRVEQRSRDLTVLASLG